MPPLFHKLAGQIQRITLASESDRDLLIRFREQRDEEAFTQIVRRHGPMVLGVCRRMLGDCHASEDAFQATFAVLARRVGSVRWQESVAGWLHTVARQVCLKARARSDRERMIPLPEEVSRPETEPTVTDLRAALDEELVRLPTKYRTAIVLCHLEGQTAEEAARVLGCTEGQLRAWLHRGRDQLHRRLTRRGMVLPVATLGLLLSQSSMTAASITLMTQTVAVATLPGAVIPAPVHELTFGVLRAMSYVYYRNLTALVMVLTGFTGFGLAWRNVSAQGPAEPPRPVAVTTVDPAAKADPDVPDPKKEQDAQILQGVIKALEAGKLQVTLEEGDQRTNLEIPLNSAAEVRFGDQKINISDLKVGMHVQMSFRGLDRVPFKIEVSWPAIEKPVSMVDATGKTIKFQISEGGFDADVALGVTNESAITLDGIPVSLSDLTANQKVRVELTIDKKAAGRIEAAPLPGDLPAQVQSIGADNTLLVRLIVTGHKDEFPVTLAFPLTTNVKVRYQGRDLPLSELKPKMAVILRLAADRKTITSIFAGAPQLDQEKEDD